MILSPSNTKIDFPNKFNSWPFLSPLGKSIPTVALYYFYLSCIATMCQKVCYVQPGFLSTGGCLKLVKPSGECIKKYPRGLFGAAALTDEAQE